MSNQSEIEKLILEIEKFIPSNNNINFVLVLLRILPIFLICHDWNIHYKHSITYFISYYTTLPLIHQSNAKNIAFYLVCIFFIIAIINIIIFFKLYSQLKEYGKLIHPNLAEVNIQTMYFINFIFSPFIFMISTENYFCTPIYDKESSYKLIKGYEDDCRDYKNIIIIIIQTFLFIWNIILNIIFSCLTAKPLCFTSSFVVSKLNEIKVKLAFFPLYQIVLVFDYYLPFKICTFIRIFARGIYNIFFINLIIHESKNFYTDFNIRFILLVIYSMNFISCIIEYIFLFDLKNNLIILQKNGTIVVFKILMEISFALLIIQYINSTERKYTLQVFKGKICFDFPYELLNKIFYIFNHVERKIGNDLLYEIIENFDSIYQTHLKENQCLKISGLKCYCKKFTYDNFLKQVDDYLDSIRDIREGAKPIKKLLKNKFPVMYRYLEYFIRSEIIKNKNNTNQAFFILALVLFYIIFDKNYNKSLFYVEEFSNTKFYKENKIVRLQTKLIKLVILDDYKNFFIYSPEKENKKHTENSFPEMYKIYSKLNDKISIENNLITVLKNYIYSLTQYKEKDCTLNECINLMKKFRKSLNILNTSLTNIYSKNPISSYHLCAKLTLFYSFFYLEIPKNLSICYKNIFEIECIQENFSTLIINTYNNRNNWKFTIEYSSDELCSKLGYCLYELKGKEINELFPDSLKKCFEYIILEKIRLGIVQILLREIVLVNKEKYASLFDMVAIVIFTGDSLKLFMKVYPYNYKQTNNMNKKKKENKYKAKKNQKKKKNNKEECFSFINKNGKIIAISKYFEAFFCLNLNTIKKYKVNLFKDILKIENIRERDIIKKNLAQVYENIAELNFNLMQNSSNEEFSRPYKKIKKLQKEILRNINTNLICNYEERELAKNEREFKQYYFVCFNIEFENKIMSFEDYFKTEANKTGLLSLQSNTKIGDIVLGIESKNIKKTKFDLNMNQNEVLNKIRQIQILSIKQLIANYNINIKELLQLNEQEEEEFNEYNNIVEKETNRLISSASNNKTSNSQLISIDNLETFFRIRMDEKYQEIERKKNIQPLKYNIYLQVFIWILFIIIFIILQTFTIIIERRHNKKTSILTDILINSLIARNIIYSFVSSLISMQYIANHLQNDTIIDNGFTNTIEFHKNRINEKIEDYLFYYKLFERQEKYLVDYNEQEIINIFFTELDYISVKSDNLIVKDSLHSILSSSHLNAYEVIENEIEAFNFNVSYYTIENRKLLNESAFFQFVFDNYFCNGKYTWDEIDNLLFFDIKHDSHTIIIYIYIINIVNGVLMIIVFVFQSFFFNKFTNQIYAKYYINYNYLQFFNNLLLKKANIIKEFIDNTAYEKFYKLNYEKLDFTNKYDDNNIFKNNYIRINNKIPMVIKPYNIQIIKKEDPSRENSLTFLNFSKISVNNSNNTIIQNINQIEEKKKKYMMEIPVDFFSNHHNSYAPIIKHKTPKQSNSSVSKFSQGNENSEMNNNKNNDNQNNTQKKPTLFKIMNNKKKKQKKTKKKFFTGKDTTNDNLNSSSNLSNLNNLKNDSLNLLREINQISDKKELQKPKQFIIYIIFFSISCFFIVLFCIINDLVIHRSLNENVIFTKTIKNTIEIPNLRMEIFLIYAIILLKGEIITFEYKSHGYLNIFHELNYLNDIITHDILEEAFLKYNVIDDYIFKFLQTNKKKFMNLYSFISKLKTEEACDNTFKYYYKNKEVFGYNQFNPYNKYNEDELILICKNISKGINNKGINTAMESLIISIKSNFYEFKDDKFREDNLTSRIESSYFVSYQLQVEHILNKVLVDVVISWKIDNQIAKEKLTKYIIIFYVLIMTLILIILGFYLLFFPFKTLKENDVINDVESCYYNTIIY